MWMYCLVRRQPWLCSLHYYSHYGSTIRPLSFVVTVFLRWQSTKYLPNAFLRGLLPVDCLFCFSTYRRIKRRFTHHLRRRTITMSFLSSILFLIVSFRYVWLRARVCQECGMSTFRRTIFINLISFCCRFSIDSMCSNRIHSSHAECLELLPFAKWHVYDTWLLPYGKQCAYVCNAMAFVSVHFRNEKQSNWM